MQLNSENCNIIRNFLLDKTNQLESIFDFPISNIIVHITAMNNLIHTKSGKIKKINKKLLKEKKLLINLINQEDIILKIRKIMWNELVFDDIDEDLVQLSLITLLLFRSELFTVTDYKNFWHLLYKNNIVNNKDMVFYLYASSNNDDLSSFNSFKKYIIDTSNEMGTDFPDLNTTIDVFQGDTDDIWIDVLHKIESITSRPEYIKEIMENTTEEILLRTIPWVSWPNRNIITDYLVDKNISSIDNFSSYDSIREKMDGSINEEMPVSYKVLGDKISKLDAQTIEMDLYGKIPQSLLQSWLPKWVYSHPNIKQKIKIYFPGGDGIGHSAIIIKTNEGMLLLDFGLSVVNNTSPSWLPILNKVDAVLLTHAHMDHSGSIPLLYQNQKKLPIFGTGETRSMVEMLWGDTQRIINRNTNEHVLVRDNKLQALVNPDNVMSAINNYNEIKVGDPFTVLPNVDVIPHHAGHLFGSVAYEINIDGKRLIYTGDFNQGGTPLLDKANFPNDLDYSIFDGTNYNRYSNDTIPEKTFTDILANSDRIILPAFSIGRTQEMLYQLKQIKGISKWNITLTGMGGRLTKLLNINKLDTSLKDISIKTFVENEDFVEKSIVIAGQGMLQVGTSRNLFDHSKNDPRTSVVFSGYQAPNTMGAQLLAENPYLKANYKQNIVKIKFSGHTTGEELDRYIDNQSGNKIMVHSPEGAYDNMKKEDILLPSSFNRKLDIY